ncbi:hypothetical protein ABMB67_001288 [Halalkalibacter oceani]
MILENRSRMRQTGSLPVVFLESVRRLFLMNL